MRSKKLVNFLLKLGALCESADVQILHSDDTTILQASRHFHALSWFSSFHWTPQQASRVSFGRTLPEALLAKLT